MKTKVIPSLLGFILVLAASHTRANAEAVVATAGKITGNAYETTPSGKSMKLTEGAEIPAGSTIHTDADSTAGVKLVPGASTTLTPGTEASLTTLDYSQSASGTPSRAIEISLQKGTIFSSLVKHDGKADFRITTPMGVAAARGTDWMVKYHHGDGLTVSCAAGTVKLTLLDGKTVIIPGGQTARCRDGVTVILRPLTPIEIRAIIYAIESGGFSPSGGPGAQGNGGGNSNNGGGQSSNPGNISGQPTVSGNR